MSDTARSVPALGMGNTRRTFGQQKDHVTFGFANVGSSPTRGLRFTLTGLSLDTATPSVVVFQPRQSDNNENDWPDEFAVQVIATANDHIVGRVLRIDNNSGWGQELRLDFLVIELKD